MEDVSNKNRIGVEKISIKNIYTNFHLKNKGFQALSKVIIRYHDMLIESFLVRGYDNEKKKFFYFVDLPFRTIKKDDRIIKHSFILFKDKSKLDELQTVCISDIKNMHPILFDKDFQPQEIFEKNNISEKDTKISNSKIKTSFKQKKDVKNKFPKKEEKLNQKKEIEEKAISRFEKTAKKV